MDYLSENYIDKTMNNWRVGEGELVRRHPISFVWTSWLKNWINVESHLQFKQWSVVEIELVKSASSSMKICINWNRITVSYQENNYWKFMQFNLASWFHLIREKYLYLLTLWEEQNYFMINWKKVNKFSFFLSEKRRKSRKNLSLKIGLNECWKTN